MSLSKLLSQTPAHKHLKSDQKIQRLNQFIGTQSHCIIPRKGSVPIPSPQNPKNERIPSRVIKESNLSSDDDPTIHELSISKSLALAPSVVPKTKFSRPIPNIMPQYQSFTPKQQQLVAAPSQKLKQALPPAYARANRNLETPKSLYSKPQTSQDLTAIPIPSQKSQSLNTRSVQKPAKQIIPFFKASQRATVANGPLQDSKITQNSKADIISMRSKVIESAREKPQAPVLELSSMNQTKSNRKSSVSNKPKQKEFLQQNVQNKKSSRSEMSSQVSQKSHDITTVSVISGMSVTNPNSSQLSKANQELVKLFKLCKMNERNLEQFPYLKQLVRSEQSANLTLPHAVTQFDRQYEQLKQNVFQTASGESIPTSFATASKVQTYQLSKPDQEFDSTDEYMQVDEAPQKIRNSSLQKSGVVGSSPLSTPNLKSVNLSQIAQVNLSVIDKSRQLLGQLDDVKNRLKQTMLNYQLQLLDRQQSKE